MHHVWRKFPPVPLKEPAHSMPRRLKNVINNKGGHTGYCHIIHGQSVSIAY